MWYSEPHWLTTQLPLIYYFERPCSLQVIQLMAGACMCSACCKTSPQNVTLAFPPWVEELLPAVVKDYKWMTGNTQIHVTFNDSLHKTQLTHCLGENMQLYKKHFTLKKIPCRSKHKSSVWNLKKQNKERSNSCMLLVTESAWKQAVSILKQTQHPWSLLIFVGHTRHNMDKPDLTSACQMVEQLPLRNARLCSPACC